ARRSRARRGVLYGQPARRARRDHGRAAEHCPQDRAAPQGQGDRVPDRARLAFARGAHRGAHRLGQCRAAAEAAVRRHRRRPCRHPQDERRGGGGATRRRRHRRVHRSDHDGAGGGAENGERRSLNTALITRRRFASLAGGGVAALLAPRIVFARFPDRPVRIMVGFAPGGTVDTIARVLAQALTPFIGQQVVVENRPGASASLAASAVVRSEADGHTLLFGVFSHAVAPALAHLTYDTLADLTAVSQVASVPLFMFAAGKAPFRSGADAVAAAKDKPETITYGSGGVGSSAHLAGELFARRAGVRLVHVPYRGGGPAVQSLLAGDVQILWDTPQPSTRSFIDQGQLRALAVMGGTRLPAYPEIASVRAAR